MTFLFFFCFILFNLYESIILSCEFFGIQKEKNFKEMFHLQSLQ